MSMKLVGIPVLGAELAGWPVIGAKLVGGGVGSRVPAVMGTKLDRITG